MKVYEAIVRTDAAQGALTDTACINLGIATLPIAYGQHVESQADGVFGASDKNNFRSWMADNVPQDYAGPACIDYENPYWSDLTMDFTLSESAVDAILAVYGQILAFAKAERPRARWGFYGLPRIRYANWPTGAEERLWKYRRAIFVNSGALFPSIYDTRAGTNAGRDLVAVGAHIQRCLWSRLPMYMFVRPRYTGDVVPDEIIPDAEFTAHVTAGMRAMRQSDAIVLWDNYPAGSPEEWGTLDALHADSLDTLHTIAAARSQRKIRAADLITLRHPSWR